MGRLVDADELLKAMNTWDKFGNIPKEGLIPLRTPTSRDRYVPYVKYDDMVKCVKGMSTVEAIPKVDYEARLKADMVAMLKRLYGELKMIHERYSTAEHWDEAYGVEISMEEVRKKINDLRGKDGD